MRESHWWRHCSILKNEEKNGGAQFPSLVFSGRVALFGGVFSGWCREIKTANLDKRHEWRGDHRIFSGQHLNLLLIWPPIEFFFPLPRNLKPSGIQICLLMLIFRLSFPPFVNGDQRGRRRQEKEGGARAATTDGMFSAQNMSTPVIKCAPTKRKDRH